MQTYKEKFDLIRGLVLEQIELSREIQDEEVYGIIDEEIQKAGKQEYISLAEKQRLRREVFNSMRRLDILQELVEDDEITEIMINGYQNIFIEKQGRLFACDKEFVSRERLEDIIQQIVAKANRIVNETNPIVDARLEDGSRVNVVLAPVAINGPIVTIRKFPANPITMSDLIEMGSITEEAAVFLQKLVQGCYNIFISGGTGSGKTTFLNVLSNYIPKDERVITIEDSAELQLRDIPNLVSLEVRNANVEGKNEIAIEDLLKSALRMRPNRIVLGEVRDGAAAANLIQIMSSGHDGSISTGHSNSAKDMLNRLETLVLSYHDIPLAAVGKQIASAIDIVIHLGRMRDKSRRIMEITEVEMWKDGDFILNPLYQFVEKGSNEGKVEGELVPVHELKNQEKLKRAGIVLQ